MNYFSSLQGSEARLKLVISQYLHDRRLPALTLNSGTRLRKQRSLALPHFVLSLSFVIPLPARCVSSSLFILPFCLLFLPPLSSYPIPSCFLSGYSKLLCYLVRGNLSDAHTCTLVPTHGWQMVQKAFHQQYRTGNSVIGQHPALRNTASCSKAVAEAIQC